MHLAEQVRKVVVPIVEGQGAMLIDVAVRGDHGGRVVEIFVDTDEGVTTELCADISRAISRALDATALFQHRYHLVVSSPGMDRPLVFPRQYPKNIGRRMVVKMRGKDGVETIEGELVGADGERIVVRDTGGKEIEIPYAGILEAKVQMPW